MHAFGVFKTKFLSLSLSLSRPQLHPLKQLAKGMKTTHANLLWNVDVSLKVLNQWFAKIDKHVEISKYHQ